MKVKITQLQAYELISNACAVIIDNDALCYPSLDEDDDVWLFCDWNMGEVSFNEESGDILFDGNSLYLKDSSGEERSIRLLVNLEDTLIDYKKITIEDFQKYVTGWLIEINSPDLSVNNMKAALHNASIMLEDDQDGIIPFISRGYNRSI